MRDIGELTERLREFAAARDWEQLPTSSLADVAKARCRRMAARPDKNDQGLLCGPFLAMVHLLADSLVSSPRFRVADGSNSQRSPHAGLDMRHENRLSSRVMVWHG
jgi:hypothetical protein